jgi:hypothetical protein
VGGDVVVGRQIVEMRVERRGLGADSEAKIDAAAAPAANISSVINRARRQAPSIPNCSSPRWTRN